MRMPYLMIFYLELSITNLDSLSNNSRRSI